MSGMDKIEMIEMAGGGEVPKAAVDALTEYDREVWPGATFHHARAAIVRVVMQSLEELGWQAPPESGRVCICLTLGNGCGGVNKCWCHPECPICFKEEED